MKTYLGFILCFATVAFGLKGYGPTDQEWGYITVRNKAHMFWWLHYTTATTDPLQRPLIVWIPGGPGASSSGFGYFNEIGPLDINENPRNSSWVNYANLLLVDSPVGSGFSYVEDPSLYATDNAQIAKDFLVFLQGFFRALPKFQKTPLYLVGESYAAKMAAESAVVLQKAIHAGTIKCNFKGLALGSAWISTIDSSVEFPEFLYNNGVIDTSTYNDLTVQGRDLKRQIETKRYIEAASSRTKMLELANNVTCGMDAFNIYYKVAAKNCSNPNESSYDPTKIIAIMEKVKKALNLTSNWQEENPAVPAALSNDIMRPVITFVEELLCETHIPIHVYNGQSDAIIPVKGTIKWMNNLKWPNAAQWKKSDFKVFDVDGFHQGFEKSYDKLHFYSILRSGHLPPADNPNAVSYMLRKLTNNFAV